MTLSADLGDDGTRPGGWGGGGTLGQHAFDQLLHQGTVDVPSDFFVVREGAYDPARQAILNANALAQAEALAAGRRDASLEPYRRYPRERPSSMLTLERLDARNLGSLRAPYQHKLRVQALVW